MAVPANSIPASLAHGATHITSPDDLPETYTIIMSGDRMLPKFAGGSAQVFSAAIEPKPGDIVAIWFRRGSSVVYPRVVLRLVSINKSEVVAKTLSPPNQFKFDAADIVAIHVWLGKPGVFGVMGTALSQAGSHAPAAVINPRDLPKQYALPGKALRPAITSDDKQMFSTVDVPKKGDVVVVWRNPETLAPGEPQAAAYRLAFDLSDGTKLGDTTRVRTPDDYFVFLAPIGTDDPRERLIFRASEVEAIHKWAGIWPAGSAIPPVALPEPKKELAPESSVVTVDASAPILFVKDGGVFASSRDIAKAFEKEHFHVLRDIDGIKGGNPDLDDLWFQEVKEFSAAANKEVRYFNLTRDGFVLLVMGYTGKTAINLKIRWIQEFNRMEEELRNGSTGDVLAIADRVAHLLEARFAKALSRPVSQPIALPYGKTSGEIWHGYGLPTIKNGPTWLGNRLEELGCLLEGSGKGQLGSRRARIFDPAKVKEIMNGGLLANAKRYAERRTEHPQMRLIA